MESVHQILRENFFENITESADTGEARRRFGTYDYDLCVINAPLGNEYGETLAADFAHKGICPVLLLTGSDKYEFIAHTVEKDGVIVLAKPINRALFINALRISRAVSNTYSSFRQKNSDLLKYIEDLRSIDRAKCTLMSVYGMNEQEAHRYIEKKAMDTRRTRRSVADEIINACK